VGRFLGAEKIDEGVHVVVEVQGQAALAGPVPDTLDIALDERELVYSRSYMHGLYFL
jgi:hypothetical protein